MKRCMLRKCILCYKIAIASVLFKQNLPILCHKDSTIKPAFHKACYHKNAGWHLYKWLPPARFKESNLKSGLYRSVSAFSGSFLILVDEHLTNSIQIMKIQKRCKNFLRIMNRLLYCLCNVVNVIRMII